MELDFEMPYGEISCFSALLVEWEYHGISWEYQCARLPLYACFISFVYVYEMLVPGAGGLVGAHVVAQKLLDQKKISLFLNASRGLLYLPDL